MSGEKPTLDYGRPEPKLPLRKRWYPPMLILFGLLSMLLIVVLLALIDHLWFPTP